MCYNYSWEFWWKIQIRNFDETLVDYEAKVVYYYSDNVNNRNNKNDNDANFYSVIKLRADYDCKQKMLNYKQGWERKIK